MEGASDHGVSEALYLRDPDGNGLELYWDRPKEEWLRAADGSIEMISAPLDLRALRAAADASTATEREPLARRSAKACGRDCAICARDS